MPDPPLVSVVIPAFQGERFLGEAIESVLAQDYPRVETIVVDDGSTDGTARVAAGYPVRLLRQENRGVAAARNAGLDAAAGEFLSFLDQDDLWEPDKVSAQAAVLVERPEVEVVMCRMRWFLQDGVARPGWARAEWFTEPQPAYLTGVALVRRRAYEAVGGFDTDYAHGSDTDWMLRARDAGLREELVDRVLFHHRLHEDNASWDLATSRRDLALALKRSLHRRRAHG